MLISPPPDTVELQRGSAGEVAVQYKILIIISGFFPNPNREERNMSFQIRTLMLTPVLFHKVRPLSFNKNLEIQATRQENGL
jgi:hypothetical protein